MIRLLTKFLRGRRGRARLAVAGVATCTLLVVVVIAAFRSVRTVMSGYIAQPGMDLWVGPRDSDNLIRGSASVRVPDGVLEPVRAMAGVAAADPILEAFLPVDHRNPDGSRTRISLLAVAYRLPDGLGGPPRLVRGRSPRTPREVAVDRAAAFRLGVRIGDEVEVRGLGAEVVGITADTNILASQFLFADIRAAAAGAPPGAASFILVRLGAGADGGAVARAIEARFPGLRAYTREEFLAANMREVTAGFAPLLALITLLGAGASALLVGLLVLSVVDDKRSDMAVLIALGMGTRTVGGGVLARAATLSLSGSVIGSVLAVGLMFGLEARMPTVSLRLQTLDLALVTLIFLATALGSALVPVLRLGAVDPLEAFRS